MKRFAVLVAVLLLFSAAIPATGGSAKKDTIRNFHSVFSVAFADNDIGVLLRNADCDFLHRVEYPDGSAKETQSCRVTDTEGLPEDQAGSVPTKAFREVGGECIWISDYWLNTSGEAIFGNTFQQVVTPSGKAHATIWYDAPSGADCGGSG